MSKASIITVFLSLLFILLVTGCSGDKGAVLPESSSPKAICSTGVSHQLWGLWQFVADPQKGSLDVIELRSGNFHLNALPFLEPPPLTDLTLESLKFNGNLIEADIGLRHPFLGLKEFTGFDVCGILITNGTKSGFEDPGIRMAGDDDTHLLNPDGWTRWWNPVEFPVNNGTIFGYQDGLLGTPDSVADFNCTLNAYKYFCDDLTDPNDPLNKITIAGRGVFSAGMKNVRHYTIELGAGLIFNYAVDACWKFPTGQPPYDVPGDFEPEANRPEAYRISINKIESTLRHNGTDSGGDLALDIDVYDWFDADLNTVQVESPGSFDAAVSSSPIGGGPGYATYHVAIEDAHPIKAVSIDLLIAVQSNVSGYGGFLPGKPVCVYFSSSAKVLGVATKIDVLIPNGGEVWNIGCYQDITWDSVGVFPNVKIEYYKDDDYSGTAVTIIDSTPNDGSFNWDPIPNDPTTTAKVHISNAGNPYIYDDSDDFFTIEPQGHYWNQLQNSPNHVGDITEEKTLHPPLKLAWSVPLTGVASPAWIEGTPVVGDGKILVTYPDTPNNWVECRSLEDGAYLWKVNITPSGSSSYISTINSCYACGRFFTPGDAIRALDADDGSIIWEYSPNPGETARHGLVYDDGRILVHLSSQIHIIDAETGDVIDIVNAVSGWANFQPFTLYQDVAYCQLNGAVRAVDLTTKTTLWSFPVDNVGIDLSVRGSPTVPGDGRVYFGCYNFSFYALNQQTGALVWRHEMSGGTQRAFDTAAYSDGKIYYGEGQGDGTTIPRFVCLNADTGSEIWGYHHPDASFDYTWTWLYSSPAVVNGVVYAACYHGYFYGFDPDNGDVLWSYPASGYAQSDPVIVDGKLLFLSDDGKLYCFVNDY